MDAIGDTCLASVEIDTGHGVCQNALVSSRRQSRRTVSAPANSGLTFQHTSLQWRRVALRFRFSTRRLEALYHDGSGARRCPGQVVQSFFEVMAIIAAAPDERDLYALKSLHFERLKGRRGQRGERSIRLNREFRLIAAVEMDEQGHYILIIGIEKHYGD